jgi:hypothetical protein
MKRIHKLQCHHLMNPVLLKPDRSSKTDRLNWFGGKNDRTGDLELLLAGSVLNRPFSSN